MAKITMGPNTLLYPQPLVLVGANVDNKPNFTTVAWTGIAGGDPPMISVALRHTRYSLKGIRENMTFSVNVPSADWLKETDYCGIVSGSEVNKAKVCRFKVFYGNLDSAPLIDQYPVNLECKVAHILDVGSHSLVVGRIAETYVSEDYLTDGKPDITKIKPVAYITGQPRKYHAVGEFLAEAYSAGKELKLREKT